MSNDEQCAREILSLFGHSPNVCEGNRIAIIEIIRKYRDMMPAATEATRPLIECGQCGEATGAMYAACLKCHKAMSDAPEFIRKAATHQGRIVCSGDLTNIQTSQAQVSGLFYVDTKTNLGFAVVPWECTTEKDRERERGYFMTHPLRAAGGGGGQ